MNIKNAQIIIATSGTFAAKFLDQLELAFPIALAFLGAIAVLVPVLFLAVRCTKLALTRPATVVACSSNFPSGFVIAGHRAELGCFHFVFGDIECFAAVFANLCCAILGPVRCYSCFPLVPGVYGGFAPTLHRAIDSCSFAVEFFTALGADMHDFSHAHIVPYFVGMCNPNYFAIAQRRIEQAAMQLPLLEVA